MSEPISRVVPPPASPAATEPPQPEPTREYLLAALSDCVDEVNRGTYAGEAYRRARAIVEAVARGRPLP